MSVPVYVSVCVCGGVMNTKVQMPVDFRDTGLLWSWSYDGCEQPCGCYEQNSGLLEEQ